LPPHLLRFELHRAARSALDLAVVTLTGIASYARLAPPPEAPTEANMLLDLLDMLEGASQDVRAILGTAERGDA
jgi:hypothetical protein